MTRFSQFDIKAPNGASCAGWDYFVNLVEPAGKTYCVRCCVSIIMFLNLKQWTPNTHLCAYA